MPPDGGDAWGGVGQDLPHAPYSVTRDRRGAHPVKVTERTITMRPDLALESLTRAYNAGSITPRRARTDYAIRVVLTDDNTTWDRVYVRGSYRLSRDAFESFALGDLIRLVDPVGHLSWTITEVDA
jgi:hypothetical protein